MIEAQVQRRNRAWLAILGMIALVGVLILVTFSRAANTLRQVIGVSVTDFMGTIELIEFVAMGAIVFFWFKGLYHWSKAKGCSGAFAIFGVLGFPIGPVVLACFRDGCPSPRSPDESARKCPSCGTPYRLGDYDPAAKQIFCSSCKAELSRT